MALSSDKKSYNIIFDVGVKNALNHIVERLPANSALEEDVSTELSESVKMVSKGKKEFLNYSHSVRCLLRSFLENYIILKPLADKKGLSVLSLIDMVVRDYAEKEGQKGDK